MLTSHSDAGFIKILLWFLKTWDYHNPFWESLILWYVSTIVKTVQYFEKVKSVNMFWNSSSLTGIHYDSSLRLFKTWRSWLPCDICPLFLFCVSWDAYLVGSVQKVTKPIFGRDRLCKLGSCRLWIHIKATSHDTPIFIAFKIVKVVECDTESSNCDKLDTRM